MLRSVSQYITFFFIHTDTLINCEGKFDSFQIKTCQRKKTKKFFIIYYSPGFTPVQPVMADVRTEGEFFDFTLRKT